MNNITYTQGVESGKFVFKLFTTDTGNKSFQIALNFSYAASGLSYDSISFIGSSSVSASASNINGLGNVNINGQVSTNLVAGEPFAVINFTGDGSGTFDLDVIRFVLEGLSVNLGNPPLVSYNIPNLPDIQSVKVLEDKSISGVFNPFNAFFGYQIAVNASPKHGDLKIVSDFLGNQSWVYTPSANYNGSDVFSIKSTSGSTTKIQQLNVSISPVNDLPTGSLTINGVLKQGETVTVTNNLADFDGLGTISYVWQSSSDNQNWSPLFTGTSLVLSANQVGKYLKVIASYTDAQGTSESVSLASSETVKVKSPVITTETHSLSVIVNQGVLEAGPVLLKNLKETFKFIDGLLTEHFVQYGDLSFDYTQIDPLITTITRDGEFTAEFTKEINDYLGAEQNISYSAAVAIVGATSIDGIILAVAGADGNFVG